jgi:hypothetical protein
LQFVGERTCFELICVQLLKHAPRVFPVFVVLAKHYVLFKGRGWTNKVVEFGKEVVTAKCHPTAMKTLKRRKIKLALELAKCADDCPESDKLVEAVNGEPEPEFEAEPELKGTGDKKPQTPNKELPAAHEESEFTSEQSPVADKEPPIATGEPPAASPEPLTPYKEPLTPYKEPLTPYKELPTPEISRIGSEVTAPAHLQIPIFK